MQQYPRHCRGPLGRRPKASSGHVVHATYAQADPALRNDVNGSLENGKSDDSSLKMVAEQDVYSYSSLKPDRIRLLGLIPHEDENAPIQCRLFEYPLQDSGERVHLYEALSYVWGCSDKPYSISIGRRDLPVTANLYAALLHLRDRFIERTIWVDAICINQNNLQEQEQQIQYMAEIYSKTSRVIVWLGEAAADSDVALEEIRVAADNESAKPLVSEPIKASILALLQRPWFERIWVLQEVAAARHILIMCGSTTIDGYTFCLGLQSLQLSYDALTDLQNMIRSVTHLIRGAIFRPRRVRKLSGRVSLDIYPLGQLIEMYHTRKATERHDKVFSLLGMSSDDPIAASLSPNYAISWEKLLEQLVKFLLGRQILVKTWAESEMAVIKGKGCILGRVSSKKDTDRIDKQQVFISSKISGDLEPGREWTLPASAKSVQVADLVCLLDGASNPTIIRLQRDHFSVIMIAVPPLQREQPITNFPHDFLLVWDLGEYQGKLQDREEYKTLIKSRVPDHWNREEGSHLDKMTRFWNAAQILEDVEEYGKAEERLQEIVKGDEKEYGKEHLRTLIGRDHLALIYKKMKRWEKAEKLFDQVIQTRKRVQGADHPDTTTSMTNLALLYRDQKRVEEAVKLEAMRDILNRKRDGEQITEEEVIKFAGRFDKEVMTLLLDQRGDDVQITGGVVAAAVGNWKRRHEVMRLLLERRRGEVQITEEVVRAVIRNSRSRLGVMIVLLDRKWDEVEITEGAVIQISKFFGEEVMKLLLDRRGGEVQITEGVVTAAAGNGKSGHEVMKLLLDRKGDDIQITEGVVTAAAGNGNSGHEVMELLLDRRGNEVQITEGVVTAAAGNGKSGHKVMKLLLDRRGDDVQITEGVVTAAAKNEGVATVVAGDRKSGHEIMRLLLDRRGDDVQITERVVTAAAENKDSGHEVMKLLLYRKRDEAKIDEAYTWKSSRTQQFYQAMVLAGGKISIDEAV